MRLIFCFAAVIGIAAGGQPPAARHAGMGDDPWRFVHPRATWIAGVDWGRAKNSAAGQILQRQLEGAKDKVTSAGLGLGALDSVERILLSGVSMQNADKAAPEEFVVAIEGKIDRAKLKKELPPGTAVEKFRGADLFVPPKADPKDPLVAVVSDSLMLMGGRNALQLVLSGKGGAQDADLAGRAARLAGESEMWMAAAAPPREQPAENRPPDPFQDLERLELGVSLREGLRLAASLTAESEQSAQGLAGFLQLAGVMGGDDAAAVWLRRLQVKQKGKDLALLLDVPVKDLERGIEAGKAAVQQAGLQALETALGGGAAQWPEGLRPAVKSTGAREAGPAAAVLAAKAPEPKVRTIRIVGAEDGPKEIQYTAPARINR
jgi:hypothetical protein